ncbi:MAG TPA: hypothetical protein VKX45_05415 [Bryobacteraceae bacterium]|jgi:hypothetical protein|nr:hypothetical protein [Bryobacteraceae bacterium]
MNHLSEEQLILHYYGEGAGEALPVEVHLEDCASCRAAYAALQRVLNVVDGLEAPVRGAEYGAQVWERVAAQIPGRRRLLWLPIQGWAPLRWAAVSAVMAGLLVAAFFAGRFYPQPRRAAPMAAADPKAGERILLVAVGDYLERSQMILVELENANAKEPLDISSEQERAADLVGESRLYRQTAERTGDTRVAGVLDDLDRVLLEIAHAPSHLSPEDLDKLRQRLQAEGILFKIRVLGSNVRSLGEEGAGKRL